MNTSISKVVARVRLYTYSHATGTTVIITPTKTYIGGAESMESSPRSTSTVLIFEISINKHSVRKRAGKVRIDLIFLRYFIHSMKIPVEPPTHTSSTKEIAKAIPSGLPRRPNARLLMKTANITEKYPVERILLA